MSTELTLFDQARPAVPSHVANFLQEESNIEARITVPSLSYEGKVWQISVNGEKTKLMKRDADGDEVPVGIFRGVILDYAKRRGRAYYTGSYDPAKPGTPECWSDDGVKPHASVKEPKCGTCEGCPMAAKGSKVTEQGKAIAACSQHRMIALVPAFRMDSTPLRLKIAITSDWDKQNPEAEAQGWFAFNNYTDFLRTKGVQHTAALVTKIRFDAGVAYPKLQFSPDRWLEEAEIRAIAPIAKSENVKKLLAGTYTPAGPDGVEHATQSAPTQKPLPAETKPAPILSAAATPPDEDEEVVEVKETVSTPAPKETSSPPKAKTKAIDPDDIEAPAKPAKKAAAPETSSPPPAAPSGNSDDLAALLSEWDD